MCLLNVKHLYTIWWIAWVPMSIKQNKFVSSNRMTDFANRIFLMRVKSVCHLHFWFLIKPCHQPWSILCNHHHNGYPTPFPHSLLLGFFEISCRLTYYLLNCVPSPVAVNRPPKDIQCQCQTTTKVLWLTNSYPVVWKDTQWLSIRWDTLPCYLSPQ